MHKTFLLYSWLLLVTHHTHTSGFFQSELFQRDFGENSHWQTINTEVQLASAGELEKRFSSLNDKEIIDFVLLSTIIQDLGNKTDTPNNIYIKVCTLLDKYSESYQKDLPCLYSKLKFKGIRKILYVIFADHPKSFFALLHEQRYFIP